MRKQPTKYVQKERNRGGMGGGVGKYNCNICLSPKKFCKHIKKQFFSQNLKTNPPIASLL